MKPGQRVYFNELNKVGTVETTNGAGSLYGKEWVLVRWSNGFGSWILKSKLEVLK